MASRVRRHRNAVRLTMACAVPVCVPIAGPASDCPACIAGSKISMFATACGRHEESGAPRRRMLPADCIVAKRRAAGRPCGELRLAV
jgi:hypothetical protein